jgi:hypothetical protein
MFTGLIRDGMRRSQSFAGLAVAVMTLVTAALTPTGLRAEPNWAEELVFKAQKEAEASVRRSSVRVASLGAAAYAEERASRPRRASIAQEDRPQSSRRNSGGPLSSSAGNVSWVASAACLESSLRGVIVNIASSYGPVRVSSTCRSSSRNRSVGGAGKSYHLTGNAADFRVFAAVSSVYASLRSNGSVGGLKHYGGGLFHIDTGPRRSW